MDQPTVVTPQYSGRCFSDLPKTIRYLLTGNGSPGLDREILGPVDNRWKKVVLFFVDAFGWSFCKPRLNDFSFLHQFTELGVAESITAQFPSTTAAHVTCIHTGLSPIESGVFEWQYYEPLVDDIIIPLLFSPVGVRTRNALDHIEPEQILPSQTIYRDLENCGIRSCGFQPSLHLASPYARLTYDGAEVVPYRTLSEGLTILHQRILSETDPSYFFFYFDGIDQVGHSQGPQSLHFSAEIDSFLLTMERIFGVDGDGETLLMLVADHGMTQINPKNTIYLNIEPEFQGVERFLRTNSAGRILVPVGSCRDMFLYIKEGMLEEAQAFLELRLHGRAQVISTSELVSRGFFGPGPASESFNVHVGDLVILPNYGEAVWWYERGKFEQTLFGGHGGLTSEEMMIPFLARPY